MILILITLKAEREENNKVLTKTIIKIIQMRKISPI